MRHSLWNAASTQSQNVRIFGSRVAFGQLHGVLAGFMIWWHLLNPHFSPITSPKRKRGRSNRAPSLARRASVVRNAAGCCRWRSYSHGTEQSVYLAGAGKIPLLCGDRPGGNQHQGGRGRRPRPAALLADHPDRVGKRPGRRRAADGRGRAWRPSQKAGLETAGRRPRRARLARHDGHPRRRISSSRSISRLGRLPAPRSRSRPLRPAGHVSPTTPTPPPTASSGSAPAAISTAWCCSPWARASAAASSSATCRSTARTATAASAATSSSTVRRTPAMCGCGQRGHLEAYASATAVIKRTREALDAGRDSSLGQAASRKCHELDAEAGGRRGRGGRSPCRWRSSPRRPAIWPSASST